MARYVAVLALLVAVSCWPVNAGMLKKLLMAQLLTTPRVIAVPVPVHPRPPPHHYHHPPPPPPPQMVPVPIPVHHYHYPPTHILPPPVVKLPPAELTDLSHLHALFDATHAPPPQDFQFDIVQVETASKPKKTTAPAFAAYAASVLKQKQSKGKLAAPKEQALWTAMEQAAITGMSAPEEWKPYMPQYGMESRAPVQSTDDAYDWVEPPSKSTMSPAMSSAMASAMSSAMSSAYYSNKKPTMQYPRTQSLYYKKSPSYSSSMPSYNSGEYGWSDGGSFLYSGTAKKPSVYSPQHYAWATEVASPKASVGTSSGPAARHDLGETGVPTYASSASPPTDATTASTTTQASRLEAPEPPTATSASRRSITLVRKNNRDARR